MIKITNCYLFALVEKIFFPMNMLISTLFSARKLIHFDNLFLEHNNV